MNSFNSELQLKDTEFAIRHELVNLLKGFKFMTTLDLEFKKQKKMITQNLTAFIQTQKQK